MRRQTKRVFQPSLFSETAPILTLDDWIKAFAVMWLTYLLFNTENPLSTLLNPKALINPAQATLSDNAMIISGGVIYAGLMIAGIFWAGGSSGFKKLFAKFRVRDIFLILMYGSLSFLFQLIGNYITTFLPNTFDVDFEGTLQVAQLQSLSAFLYISCRLFFFYVGDGLFAIMVFLACYQFFKSHLKNQWLCWGLTYFLAAGIAGALTTTPINAHLFLNIIAGGVAQIPLYWAYRHTQNALVSILAAYIINRLLVLSILVFNG